MSKGVAVKPRREKDTVISLWCSGKLLGWVSARNRKEVSIMAKMIIDWFGLTYDHNKHDALIELKNGEQYLKNLINDGKLR